MPLYNNARQPQTQFALLHRSLLQSDELPFQSLISDERMAEIFAEEGVDFGQTDDAVYTPAITPLQSHPCNHTLGITFASLLQRGAT